MKISVALCTYNGAQYLQEQLHSIAQQTRLPDELVICDDKSNDNTIEIINSFVTKAPFSVNFVFNSENMGSTPNFERAIKLCTGDVITLSDQDDVWYPEKLKCIEKAFLKSDLIGAVFSDADVVDENLNQLGYRMWESINFSRKEQKRWSKGDSREILLKHNVVTGATMAFRSEYKDLVLPIPSIWVHDGWIALVIAFIAKIVIIPEPLIKYRQHPKQQIGAGSDTEKGILTTIRRKYKKIIHGFEVDSKEYLDHLNQYIVAYRRINAIISSKDKKEMVYFKKKIEHSQKRAELPQSRIQRFPIVTKELINLNYHRFSYGICSFGEDLLR